MKDVAPISSAPIPHLAPATCPMCQSVAVVTKAKSPDADTYWRCTKCGEVWNVLREAAGRQSAGRWR